MATILDVVDNFFHKDATPSEVLDVRRLPGRVLYEFGDEVRRFASTYTSESATTMGEAPIYLGGWPSASFWAVHGDLILSSLLYAGRVLVKDPLSDWFSDERYLVRHKMGGRPGYLTESREANVGRMRWFLAHTIPALRQSLGACALSSA